MTFQMDALKWNGMTSTEKKSQHGDREYQDPIH